MPDRPLLSVVTPCRNAARWLPRALGSVADGAPPGVVEHIIIDGASTDASRDLIAEHAAAHPALVTHWESAPDRGQSDAINKGFAHARGEFGAWLNADDWYEPGGLAAVLAALRAPGAPDAVVGRCRFVDESGATVWAPRPPEPVTLGALCRLRTRWFAGRNLVQPEVFFRLARFREAGGLSVDNHYSMDHELWLAMLARGARFATIDAPVACLGVHEAQKTRDNREAVRSILAHTAALLERSPELLGADLAAARAEAEGIGAKLRSADAFVTRWRSLREHPGTASAGEWDGQVCAALIRDHAVRAADAATRAVHAGAAAEAVQLARQRIPPGPLRVLVMLRRDPEAALSLLRALPRRPIGLSVAAFAQAALDRAMNGLVPRLDPLLHRVHAATSDASPADPPHPGERFELILTDGALHGAPDAAALLASLWPWLAPGGVLLQLSEPRPTASLEPYLRWIERRLAAQLSADDDIRLDPRADPFLDAALTGTDAAWHAAHAGAAGVDVPAILAGFDNAECALERRYGGLNFHPLTPWPCVGPAATAGEDSWGTSVWVKVR